MNVTDARSPEEPPQIEAFEFDPPAIAEEGQESKGIIKLSGPAPPDTSITLEGTPAVAEYPRSAAGSVLADTSYLHGGRHRVGRGPPRHDLHCPLLLFDEGGTP